MFVWQWQHIGGIMGQLSQVRGSAPHLEEKWQKISHFWIFAPLEMPFVISMPRYKKKNSGAATVKRALLQLKVKCLS